MGTLRALRGSLLSRIILVCVLLILVPVASSSKQGPKPQNILTAFQQNINPSEDLARARQFEQVGQYEQAVSLYERVLIVSHMNAQALSALPRLYIRLQRYDRAIVLLQQQVQRSPKNVVYRRMLADVLFKTNQGAEAQQQCQAILDLYPNNESMIRLVASIYSGHGLYDDAVRTYRHGRTTLNNPDAFALTLADLYTTLSDVPDAVIEYVRWVKLQPKQFAVVDDRIEDLAGSKDGELVQQTLIRVASEKPVRVEVLKLLGNFYLRRGQTADALEQYSIADRLSGSKGTYLLEFTSWCIREQHFEEAISAYMGMMTSSYPRPVLAQASLGLARSYHALDRIDEAMDAYKDVVTRYPRTREFEEAMFKIADIRLTCLHDPETALAEYRSLLSIAPKTDRREDVAFRIADCHVAQGGIQDAIIQYNQILDSDASGPSGERSHERAKFRLAEMALFQGRFDEAVDQFNTVADQFPGGAFANDALQWGLLLDDARRAGDEPLKAYLDGVFLKRQYRTREALEAYKQFSQRHPDTQINDLVVLEIGLVLNDLDKPHEAIAAYRDLIEGYPSSRYAVEAQRHIAEIYERHLNNIPQAITEYETILVNYPENYTNDAIRRKINDLTSQYPPRP